MMNLSLLQILQHRKRITGDFCSLPTLGSTGLPTGSVVETLQGECQHLSVRGSSESYLTSNKIEAVLKVIDMKWYANMKMNMVQTKFKHTG